ncbi:PREDICTED: potassium transporter 2-like isoform X3 [Populus euphratica]|uniref:Potassium transporter 2-like isoform X3 n=1 Tax=Populus euphratica TaxID=75702 RepID=A0AAJ6T3Z6_POPEU|nr:PREDICTED: potassium transporter 2-like isoform X3 [Populus euphratica]
MDHPPSRTTSSDGLKETWRHALVLSFQTLGVVYGRLSTAPLYVFGTIQTKDFKSNEIAYEYFSFIFWTLTVVSLLKYTFIVLRADDNGEDVPVPSACVITVCLFILQHYVYMYRFVRNINKDRWKSLGSILLCTAGSETMFTDLGHFPKRSIKITFVCLIYPVLILCYAGQAAFISKHWNGPENFNHLSESIPKHLRHVFILLSLLASAVGSQATIPASFSIINQCRALSCFPRVKVIHTSDKRHGQVYIPDVNWLLMALSLSITLGFHDITRIANAAGMAIVFGMIVTTCMMSLVMALYWEKSLFISGFFLMFFGFVEAVYVSACMLSFHKGAWYLFVLSAVSFTIMLAWHYGTMKKYEFDLQNKVSTEWLTDYSPGLGVSRVPGIGLIYTDIVMGIPAFFSHFITNLPAFHQVLIFVSFKPQPVPCVPPSQRYCVGRVGGKDYRIYRCIVRYGYCDQVRDTDDFEEQIIGSIGEYISLDESDCESLTSPEGRMVIVGTPLLEGHALIPVDDTNLVSGSTNAANNETLAIPVGDLIGRNTPVRRKKVRFLIPESSPRLRESVRDELQELINARESGTAYFLGQSHLTVRNGSNFFKKFLIMAYVFLDKNCREPPVALNIPHAALVEVGMVYII